MIHPIKFIRWARDAGWQDTRWQLLYPIRTWRCRLFGHKWGPEDRDYEPNTGCLMQAWQECERSPCEGWRETYHYTSGYAR
jgi:hypothetical protein